MRAAVRVFALLLPAVTSSGCGAGIVGLALALKGTAENSRQTTRVLPAVEDIEITAPETPDLIHLRFRIGEAGGRSYATRIGYERKDGDHSEKPPTLVPASDSGDGETTGVFHFVWDARRDLDDDSATVVVNIVPVVDGVEGKPFRSAPFRVGNTPPDVESLLLAAGGDPSGSEQVLLLSFVLKDKESDYARLLSLAISIDGGERVAFPDSIIETLPRKLPADATGFPNVLRIRFALLRSSEAPEALRAIAQPGFVGMLAVSIAVQDFETEDPSMGESGVFLLDNNDEPFIQFLPISDPSLTKGVVPIRYRIFDKEQNLADVEFEVDLGDGQGFRPAWEYPSRASSGLRALESIPTGRGDEEALPFHTFLWDGHLQAPDGGDVSFRVGARDRDPGPENVVFAEIPDEFAKPVQEIEVQGIPWGFFSAADFDLDSFPDLLIANYFETKSASYFRGGRRGLSFVANFPTGPWTCDVVSGDFNGDGYPDAAIFHTEGATVYSGSAAGLVWGERQIEYPWGDGIFYSKAADFDRDGFVDVMSGNLFTDQLFSLRGGKDGLHLEKVLPCGDEPYETAVDDFNADGYPDYLGVNRRSNDLNLFRGGPNGLEWVRLIPTSSYPQAVSAGRFDDDPYHDAVVVNTHADVVTYLRGAADPDILVESALIPVGRVPWGIAKGDFNADGFDDALVLYFDTNYVTVIEGSGAGPRKGPDIPVGRTQMSAAVGDIDGDGFQDAAVTCTVSENVAFLRGSQEGLRFAHSVDRKAQFEPLISGDFDGDGFSEFLVGLEDTGRYTRFQGIRGGLSPFSKGSPVAAGAVAIASADFDGDGFPDVAVGGRDPSAVTCLRGSAGGLLGGPTLEVAAGVADLLAGDIDGDRLPDLMVAGLESQHITVLRGGRGGLAPERAASIPVGPAPRALAAGDFDGDERLDLAVALWDTGRVIILSGQRNALPEPAADIPVGREPIALAAGDLDRDGHLDLVVANWGSGSISVIRGGPSGLGSKAPETIAAGLFPHALRIRDFNGDGLPDVAVVNYGSHDVSCFLGGKDGLAKGQRIPVGDFPAAIAAGDFDSDGFVDIATVDSGSTGISLVRGGPTGMSQSQSVGLLESGAPVGLTPLDFDGDGFLDLVVANQKPGEIVGLRGGAEGLRWGGIIAQGNRPVLLLNSDVDADGFDDVVVVDAGSARAIDLRQAYALPHGHAIVPDPASGEPLVIIDPRSPSRYRLEIEPGGGPEGEPQIAVAPTPLFPIPQEIAAAAGKYFTVLADSLALLREGTELPRPARLSLRLRDHDRSLLDAALRDPRRLKIIRRNGETGCGEIENGPIEIRELSRAKFASFPISRLACYTVVLERERQ